MASSGERAGVKGVVRRAAALLRALVVADGRGVTASQLARTVDVPLQTTHRLLGELAQEGLALQDPTTRGWTLGPELLALGRVADTQVDWLRHTHDLLANIAAEAHETTILTARTGAYATHIEIAESPHPLRLTEHVGLRLPLTVGASRRAILAHLTPTEQHEVLTTLRADGIQFDEQETLADCDQIRTRGYATTAGEVTPHTMGVAVPLLVDGQAVGSVMIAGPRHRMTGATVNTAVHLLQHRVGQLTRIWGPADRARARARE